MMLPAVRFCAAALALSLVACATDGEGTSEEDGSTESAVAGSVVIRNPVETNCADPSVMKDGATYYLTCTGGDGEGNLFPIYTSTDMLAWTKAGAIFAKGSFPTWANGNWWAPEIHRVGGKLIAVFSALDRTTKKNAIGLATSANAAGPFTDRGAPIASSAANSAIDAHLSVASGKPILYYKGERVNAAGKGADILRVMPLSDDGTEPAGDATTIMGLTEGWEGTIVEAPWVVKHDDAYYLFYSGNLYCNSSYAVGVARSKSPFGPFEKHGAPILKSGARWTGPGHNAVAEGPDGKSWIVYHAYNKAQEGTPSCASSAGDNNQRHTLVDRIEWTNGWPRVVSNL